MGKCVSTPPISYPITINFVSSSDSDTRTIILQVYNTDRINDIINKLNLSKSFQPYKHKYLPITSLQLKFRHKILDPYYYYKTLKQCKITSNTVIYAEYPKLIGFDGCNYDVSLLNTDEKWVQEAVNIFNKDMKPYNAELFEVYKINTNIDLNNDIFNAILRTKKNKNWTTLFHGTSFHNLSKIITNGFNRDYNQRSVYGYGTYLAKSPVLASQYCSRYNSNTPVYCMLVCNTIVGETSVRHRVQKDGITAYDTLVDNVTDPQIFVINRDYHTIPKLIFLFGYK